VRAIPRAAYGQHVRRLLLCFRCLTIMKRGQIYFPTLLGLPGPRNSTRLSVFFSISSTNRGLPVNCPVGAMYRSAPILLPQGFFYPSCIAFRPFFPTVGKAINKSVPNTPDQYNQDRPHSSLDYLTPHEFLLRWNQNQPGRNQPLPPLVVLSSSG
jgi:hypothetical protein